LKTMKVIVTCGPSYEPIDQVRRLPSERCHLSQFDTNDDLLDLLKQTSKAHEIAAVFHVAALCDYKVRRVEDQHGQCCNFPKIASRSGALTILLEPATKVISHLRDLFPRSIVVGWKYELAGTRTDAAGKAERQIAENRTNGCVVNGRAFGPGFGFCQLGQQLRERETKTELVHFLVEWIQEMVPNCPMLPHVRACLFVK